MKEREVAIGERRNEMGGKGGEKYNFDIIGKRCQNKMK